MTRPIHRPARATARGLSLFTLLLALLAIGPSPASAADTTKPSAPTALTATSQPGKVALAWGAATDNVGVTQYRVWRRLASGTTWAQLGTTTASVRAYTDSAVVAGTTYRYVVYAADAAGNTSLPSNYVSGTPGAATTTSTSPAPTPAPVAGTQIWKADAELPVDKEWASICDPAHANCATTTNVVLPDSRISRDTTTRFQGSASYRFTVQPGDDDPFSSGQRSELAMGNPTRTDMMDRLFQRGDDRWISWASRLGTDWNTTAGTWQLTNQWKQLGSLGSPVLSLQQRDSVWRIDRTTSDPNNQWPSGFRSTFDTCAAQKGQWFRWSLHLKVDPDASVGFIELFGDCGTGTMRTLIAKQYQSTQKIDNGKLVPVQARIGIYRNTLPNASTLWIDGYNVATTRALSEANAGF
jgi:hypothetical protein